MNDLFASLVDRSLGRAPVLERRQPTLFEPAIDAAFSEPSLQEKENFVEGEPPAVPSQQLFKNTAPSPQPSPALEKPEAPALETRPARRRRVRDIPTPEEDVETTRPALAPAKETKPTSPDQPVHNIQPPVVGAPKSPMPAPERTIETIVEKTFEREVIKELATQAPTIKEIQTFTQPNPQPQPPHRDQGLSTQPPSKVEVKHLPPPKETTVIKPQLPKNPAPHRDIPPTMRAAVRAEAKRRPEPPAPIINVTIGRVEVRATTPPNGKTHAARPAGPRLTLEDYLRSRGKEN